MTHWHSSSVSPLVLPCRWSKHLLSWLQSSWTMTRKSSSKSFRITWSQLQPLTSIPGRWVRTLDGAVGGLVSSGSSYRLCCSKIWKGVRVKLTYWQHWFSSVEESILLTDNFLDHLIKLRSWVRIQKVPVAWSWKRNLKISQILQMSKESFYNYSKFAKEIYIITSKPFLIFTFGSPIKRCSELTPG